MPNTSIWAGFVTYTIPFQYFGLMGKRPFAVSSGKPTVTYTSRPGRVLGKPQKVFRKHLPFAVCLSKSRKKNYNTSLHPYLLRSFVTTILCQSASKSVLSPLSNGLNGVFSTHLLAKTAVFHQPSRHFHANPPKQKRPSRYQPGRFINH